MNSDQKLRRKNISGRGALIRSRVPGFQRLFACLGLLASVSGPVFSASHLAAAEAIQFGKAEELCYDGAQQPAMAAHQPCDPDYGEGFVQESNAPVSAAINAVNQENAGNNNGAVTNWLAGARIVETSNLQRP